MARYRTVRVSVEHPLARPNSSISKDGRTVEVHAHRIILFAKIGAGPHRCHWCGQPVAWVSAPGSARLVSDHVDGDIHNNDPANLVPSCSGCNANRSHPGRIQDGEPFVVIQGRRHRAIERVCQQCGTPFLMSAALAKNGRGKFCSHSCTAKHTGLGGTRPPAVWVERTCEHCGGSFSITQAQARLVGRGRFCSRSCRARATGGRRKPKSE